LIQLRRPLDAEARLTVAGCQARLAKSYALSGAPPPEARRCDSWSIRPAIASSICPAPAGPRPRWPRMPGLPTR